MSQLALALADQSPSPLPAAPRVATAVRRARGCLVFDNEPLVRAYLAKHGEYHKTARGVLMRVRPRLTRHGWVLCQWWSGYPYVLYGDKVLRAWPASEVRA